MWCIVPAMSDFFSSQSSVARARTRTTKEIDFLNTMGFLTAKPVVFLVNLSEKDYKRKKNKWLLKIHEWIQKNSPGDVMIPYSGALESMLVCGQCGRTNDMDFLPELRQRVDSSKMQNNFWRGM